MPKVVRVHTDYPLTDTRDMTDADIRSRLHDLIARLSNVEAGAFYVLLGRISGHLTDRQVEDALEENPFA